MTKENWEGLMSQKDVLNKAIDEGEPLPRTKAIGAYKVDYKLFREKWYIGFHEYTDYDTLVSATGLNFRVDEWKVLMENMAGINQKLAVNVVSANKRTADGMKKVNIVLYSWKWVLGKKKISNSKCYFYSERDCVKNGNTPENKPTPTKDYPADKEPQFLLEKVQGSAPDIILLMRQCYILFLKEHIAQISKEKCAACKIEAPGQKDHMEPGGCIAPPKELYNLYTREARKAVTHVELYNLFDNVRRMLGAEPVDSKLLAKGCQCYLSTDNCKILFDDKSYVNIDMLVSDVYSKM